MQAFVRGRSLCSFIVGCGRCGAVLLVLVAAVVVVMMAVMAKAIMADVGSSGDSDARSRIAKVGRCDGYV